MTPLETQVLDLARKARAASRILAELSSDKKNAALSAMADALEKNIATIKSANTRDMEAAQIAGVSKAFLDRLMLDDERIMAMAKGLRQIVTLTDPVGEIISEITRPNGLVIRKIRVPIGVIAIIYESRPNVTADTAALCFKSGNAIILRGGKEAIHSSRAIVDVLTSAAKIPSGAIGLVPMVDHDAVRILAQAVGLVDLIIPRGGEALIRTVAEVARVPVIKHYKGVCHVFIDAAADLDKSERIVLNAKCQRPATCNAMETLLVHEKIAPKILPRLAKALIDHKVELRGDEATLNLLKEQNINGLKPATEDDWSAEYLDLILAVRIVRDADAAVNHITKYSSQLADAIITEDKKVADKFLHQVDSAAVYWNTSTRFTDGAEFGMGAEIGISTDKIGARGPMGLTELTSHKYIVIGNGQVRQ